jgi:uncharacterized OsmC-like protein
MSCFNRIDIHASAMTTEELKKLQAPLKEQYRQDPGTALVTLHASGHLGEDVSCSVDTQIGVVVSGLHPAAGGTGLQACSGDMLLQALVACSGVTLSAVAKAMGIVFRRAEVKAEGELDFRGTLGVSKEVPVGFRTIRLHYELDTDATVEKLDSLLKLTERYCVVYQTLLNGVSVEMTYQKG